MDNPQLDWVLNTQHVSESLEDLLTREAEEYADIPATWDFVSEEVSKDIIGDAFALVALQLSKRNT